MPPETPGIFAVWSLFLRQYKTVLLGTVVGMTLAGVYCCLSPRRFESRSELLVMQKDRNMTAARSESRPAQDPTVADDTLATLMQILLSPRVVGAALQTHGLDRRPSIVNALEEDEDAVDYVIENLRVSKGGEGQGRAARVLNLSFRHTSATDCEAVLGAVVESYRDFLASTTQGPMSEALQLLQRTHDEFERSLTKLQDKYQAFRVGAPVIWKGEESLNVHRTRVEQLESQLMQIRVDLIGTESRLETMATARWAEHGQQRSDWQHIALIDRQHLERLRLLVTVHQGGTATEQSESVSTEFRRLLEYRIQLEQLSSKLGRDHPKVRRVQLAIKETEAFLRERQLTLVDELKPAAVVAAYVGLLRSDLADLKRRKTEIEKLLSEEKQRAKALVQFELKDDQMQNEVMRRRQLFSAVVERVDEIRLARDYGGFITEVIAPVQVGEQVAPKPVLVLVLGAMLGLCLGAGSAVVVDQMGGDLHGDDDIRSTLGLPVLARFSLVPGSPTAHGKRTTWDAALVAHHWPDSREAESFRNLRALLCRHHREQQAMLLQVTSLGVSDGKTALAANLAISLARGGKSVLLVDADWRHSKVAKLFSITASRGLSCVLAGEDDVSEVLLRTELDNLSIIPSGPRHVDAVDLMMQPRFDQFLSEVKKRFDFIIFDSPALPFAIESIELAARADAVLLTSDVRGTRAGEAQEACHMLQAAGANVLGVVVDATPVRRCWSAGRTPRRNAPRQPAADRATGPRLDRLGKPKESVRSSESNFINR